jgi:hypothetical protein
MRGKGAPRANRPPPRKTQPPPTPQNPTAPRDPAKPNRPHPAPPRPATANQNPLSRHAPLRQVLADLALDALQGVVDRLAIAAQAPADLLVGVAVEV